MPLLSRRRARAFAAAGAALALAGTVVLAGCTDDAPDDAETTPPVTLIGPGADIPNDVASRADVQTDSCEPADEEGTSWTVRATATNPTDGPVVYELALRMARKSDGSVLGREALTTDPVPAGESAPIEITSTLDEPSDDINCIFVAINRVADDAGEDGGEDG